MTPVNNIRIWQMNDYEWAAASDLDGARQALIEGYEYTEAEADACIENPFELTDDQADRLIYIAADGARMSFREGLAMLVENGESFPRMFASTEEFQ